MLCFVVVTVVFDTHYHRHHPSTEGQCLGYPGGLLEGSHEGEQRMKEDKVA